MADIHKTLKIDAPIDQVWKALTDPQAIQDWMDDDMVKLDLTVGGHFTVFSGETTGTFSRIEAPNLLDYTWRQTTWKKSWADSLVQWELIADGERTQLQLTHSQFPNDEERDSHDEGWEMYWLEPMTDWLETEK